MPSTPTRDLPEEFLAATRKSQEVAIRAIKTWVETVRTVTPKLPSVYGPLTDRLPKLPSVTAPFADRLPKPEDVVASGYDFAEHLLAIQRKFAEDVLAATEPLIPVSSKRAWQHVTRKDAAAAAEKTVDGREDRGDRDRPCGPAGRGPGRAGTRRAGRPEARRAGHPEAGRAGRPEHAEGRSDHRPQGPRRDRPQGSGPQGPAPRPRPPRPRRSRRPPRARPSPPRRSLRPPRAPRSRPPAARRRPPAPADAPPPAAAPQRPTKLNLALPLDIPSIAWYS